MTRNKLDSRGVSARLQELASRAGGPAAMARKSGVPLSTLEFWLAGKNLPGCRGMAAISASLGVSIDWIVFGTEAS
jgi:hypothetical protein